ncbi:MAG: ABC transporter permease subunit [Candidatus Nanopelagicales bacterium]
MRGSVGRDARLAALVIVPLVLLVGVFVLLPTAIVVHDALTLDGRLGVDALRRTVTDAERVWFVETTVICAVSAVIAGVLGLLLALAVVGRRRPRRLHRLLTSWAATRSRIGGVPLAFAFVATIGVQGVLTRVLVDLGVPVRRDDGTVGFWPMVLVYLYFLVPLMLLVVLPAAASVPRTWSEAAAALGCSRWRYWRCVGTPVLAPAAAGGVVLLFVTAFTAHATARVLEASDRLVPERIRHVLNGESAQDDLALATIVWMLALLLCSVLLTTALQRRTLRMTRR